MPSKKELGTKNTPSPTQSLDNASSNDWRNKNEETKDAHGYEQCAAQLDARLPDAPTINAEVNHGR